MSKLSINQASKLFKVSRNTIYARIKKGDMTKDSEGLVSAQDMVRLFGNKTDKKATEKAVTELLNSREQTVQGSEQEVAHLKSNNEQLLEQQIEQLTQKMNSMKVRSYDLMEALEASQEQSKQLTEALTKVATEMAVEAKDGQIQFVDIIERAKTLAALEVKSAPKEVKDNVVPFPTPPQVAPSVPPAPPAPPVAPTEA